MLSNESNTSAQTKDSQQQLLRLGLLHLGEIPILAWIFSISPILGVINIAALGAYTGIRISKIADQSTDRSK